MRVLVVEDQKKMAGFIKKGLEEAGHLADTAESAASAHVRVSNEDYELIILDVMLPDRTGFDVARELRRDGFKGFILMLTALSGTREKVSGLDAGADDYLVKPFEFEELLARIRALERRHSGNVDSILRFEDLEMNLLERKVKRAGVVLDLTPKEFALLQYFLRNPKRVLSRTELGEHVWDIHFDSESNVIDAYIKMLRKKVDHPFAVKLIHTVTGIGYVLKVS